MVRRSLHDALAPEKIAFIESGPNTGNESGRSEPERARKTTTIDIETSKSANADHGQAKPKSARRSSRGHLQPEATEILDEVLVPVTIRLPRRISQALRRAYLEQKLKNAKPDTLQEIGEEAMTNWLNKNGYLD